MTVVFTDVFTNYGSQTSHPVDIRRMISGSEIIYDSVGAKTLASDANRNIAVMIQNGAFVDAEDLEFAEGS